VIFHQLNVELIKMLGLTRERDN